MESSSSLRKLVITGGAASGKSWCARWLENRAAGRLERFDADAAVHELLCQEENIDAIVARFGPGVRDEAGLIDRPRLARRVFAEARDRRWLEELLHPQVAQRRSRRIEELERDPQRKICWIVAEIPLWFEAEVAWKVDSVLVVGCDRRVQSERLSRIRHLEVERIESLLDSQWTSQRKAARADLVCWNDGSLASIERQLEQLYLILFA